MRLNRAALLGIAFLGVVLSAASAQDPDSKPEPAWKKKPSKRIVLDSPPADWKRRPPEKMPFACDYDLPAAVGSAAGARANVLFEPLSLGEYRKAILAGWKTPEGLGVKLEDQRVERIEAKDVKVTVVETTGTYSHEGEAPKAGFELVATHIDAPGGAWSAWLIGPEKSVAARRDTFLAWVKTARFVEVVLDFEADEVGKAPAGFTQDLTGEGGPVSWVVRADPKAPSGAKVLVQESTDATNRRYPLCIYDGLSARDVAVEVRFKPISGKVDQAAGVVCRLKDKDDYYLTRANALEDNVRFYKVVAGKRIQLGSADTKVSSEEWHSLRLEANGRHFRVVFDGKVVLEAEDETFGDAGKVGLWTKADSVTAFDDLMIERLEKKVWR